MGNAAQRLIATLMAGGMAMAPLQAQTSDIFINNGLLTESPQVDARAFVNNGLISIGEILPFETYNTRFFTNRGSMQNFAGFRLALVDPSGGVQPADTILNTAAAQIAGNDILFRATNITHKGLISALDFTGLVRLDGHNVDVSRSRIDIPSPTEFLSQSIRLIRDADGNVLGFQPEIGVFDSYWSATNIGMNVGNLMRLIPQGDRTNVIVQPPNHPVLPGGGTVSLGLVNASGWVLTNSLSPTNQIVQAIFGISTDTNFVMNASWEPSFDANIALQTAYLQFTTQQTNVITGSSETFGLTVIDWLGPETNAVILTNLQTAAFGRPSNYEVTIRQESGFTRPNDVLRADLFTHFYSEEFPDGQEFTNNVVTNFMTAYRGVMSGLVPVADPVPGSSLTNNAGRVDIKAKNLDMSNVRIRAQGGVNIDTEHLISSTNAAVDVAFLNYALGATNGLLRVTSLSKPFVQRISGGAVRLWSAVWTNGFSVTVTNTEDEGGEAMRRLARLADDGGGDDGGGDDGGGNETTETIEYTTVFHVLVVENTVRTTTPVQINEFTARSPSTLIGDELTVTGPFRMNSEALTVNGTLALSSGFNSTSFERNWTATNSPNLRFLTNQGRISVNGILNLGGDRATPLDALVNHGTNTSFGTLLRAGYFENSGDTVVNFSGLDIGVESANLNGGRLESANQLSLNAGQLRMRNAVIRSLNDTVLLSISGSVSDVGASAASQIRAPLGVTMDRLPPTGDLLGTTVEVTPIPFAEAALAWPAKDNGKSAGGFANNAAIGRLVLDAQNNSIISLRGIGGGSAVYVDSLELGPGMLDRLEDVLSVLPGFKVYFAGANVPVDQLDGRLGGALEWVSDFAGAYSGMDILIPGGRTIRVNRAFRESMNVDSDADGLVNGIDPSPFDGVLIEDIEVARVDGQVVLRWEGSAGFTYQVQVSASLVDPDWSDVTTVEGPATGNGRVEVMVPLPEGVDQNYYRVLYEP